MKVKILTTALALMTLIACQGTKDKTPATTASEPTATESKPAAPAVSQNPNERNPAVVGKWHGVEWLLDGKPSGADATIVHFEFKNDGSFKANYGDQHRSGIWRTTRDSLYTQEPGKKELPMKLLTATGSALDFEMNLNGHSEVIKFKKQ